MNLKNNVFLTLYSMRNKDVSGEELAKSAGVSRSAVWKAMVALKQEGVIIDSATKKGYRLVSTGEYVDTEVLSQLLSLRVIYLKSVGSTNTYAKGFEGERPALIVADEQTSGKASHRTQFPSPTKHGLYMSLLLSAKDKTADIGAITKKYLQRVARAVDGTIDGNSVMLGDEKVGGVLVETTSDGDGVEDIVIGIGVYTQKINKTRFDLIVEIMKDFE